MELSVAEGRVLGCLIEKQVTESEEGYSLTLDELRFSCNQTSGRDPVVAFDDRTVEDTLLSLKAMGLARFITVGHRAGPLTYRHRAEERWRLGRPELVVFATLLLRGPQTVDQIWKLLEDRSVVANTTEVEVALDTLAGRTPTPLAARLARSDGPDGVSWVEVLTGRYTLDLPRSDAYDTAPAMPSRRGSGLPAREPWRPDDRFDSRNRRDPRDADDPRASRERDTGRPAPAPGPGAGPAPGPRPGAGPDRDGPPEPQGRLDLTERSSRRDPGGPRDRRDARDVRDVREGPRSESAGPGVPVAVPAGEAARPAPTLVELADRLTGIERRLAAIEAVLESTLDAIRTGGGPGPSPQAPPPPPPLPRQTAPPQPQRQPGPPSRPAPSRPHR